MSERVKVSCPCGEGFTTAVRGRGTHCPKCRKRIYVRVDGTARPGGAAAPSGRPAAGKPPKATAVEPAGKPVLSFTTLDDILEGRAPKDAIDARTMWEMSQPFEGAPAMTLDEIAAEFNLSPSTVRRRITAERDRQTTEDEAKRRRSRSAARR
jgi:AraC-like DNA-binding protein